jgi:predicted ABC-class ATPase
MEALEAGARLLLVDEDTAATNFMIRDRRMQALIAKEKEPITPFIDKVGQLFTDHGISTILVMGGSGDYFDVANRVIAMQDFQPQEVTDRARAIAAEYATHRASEGGSEFGPLPSRTLPRARPRNSDRDFVKWKIRELDTIVIDREDIDLAAVEQLTDPAQLRAIAATLVHLEQHYLTGKHTLAEALDQVMAEIAKNGFDSLTYCPPGDFAMFRRFELAAALNRWRSLSEGYLSAE